MIVAETPRLLLREITEADAPWLLSLYQAPEVSAVLGPPPESLGAERANIMRHREEYYMRHGVGLWLAETRPAGEFVGRVGLLPRVIEGVGEVEVSYVIAPARWGQGYATEAARAAIGVACERLRAQRVIALIQPTNARSIRVAERLGLAYERTIEFGTVGQVSLYAGPTAPGCRLPAGP